MVGKKSFGPAKSRELREASIERDTDQFYTKGSIAKTCTEILTTFLPLEDVSMLVEPSCGTGSFVKAAEKFFPNIPIATIDIDTKAAPNAEHVNFLDWTFIGFGTENKLVVTLGNPPFGKNSSLAVKFFNSAAKYSDVIAFILPLTFSKPSIANRLDKHFHLVHFEELPKDSFIYRGKSKNVSCGFYIYISCDAYDKIKNCPDSWSFPTSKREKIEPGASESDIVSFVSTLEETTCLIQRVGTNAGKVFFNKTDIENKLSSRNFYKVHLNLEQSKRNLLAKMDFTKSKDKKNVSGMPSLSKPEVVKLIHSYFG